VERLRLKSVRGMTMLGECFFEIPIYRCAVHQHTDETDREREQYIKKALRYGPQDENIRKQIRETAINHYNSENWYSWRYNEAIGCICLCRVGTQIGGELWWVRAKRIRRGLVRKRFYYTMRKLIDLSFCREDSSDKIYDTISHSLDELSKKRAFKKRYLDLQAFRTVGPFVNWRRLLGFENEERSVPDPEKC